MTTFVLVHGAQHGAWCWQRLLPELDALGHAAVAMDLPCDDPDAGVGDYAAAVLTAIDDAGARDHDLVVVGHSLGSLTIPIVARRLPDSVRHLVFLCSVPTGPGPAIDADLASMVTAEFAGAPRDIDELGRESVAPAAAAGVWFHDCAADDAAWAVQQLRPQSRRPLLEPTPLDRWPDVAVSVVLGRDERCVNMAWAVPAATARCNGVPPIVLDGGHSPFLARPADLAAVLDVIARG